MGMTSCSWRRIKRGRGEGKEGGEKKKKKENLKEKEVGIIMNIE